VQPHFFLKVNPATANYLLLTLGYPMRTVGK